MHNCISGRVGIKQKAKPIPIKQKLEGKERRREREVIRKLMNLMRMGEEGTKEEPDKNSCGADNIFEGKRT